MRSFIGGFSCRTVCPDPLVYDELMFEPISKLLKNLEVDMHYWK